MSFGRKWVKSPLIPYMRCPKCGYKILEVEWKKRKKWVMCDCKESLLMEFKLIFTGGVRNE